MTETKIKKDVGLASDVAAVIDLFPRIVRGRAFEPGFDGIKVSVEEPKPGVVYCTVTIKGDTQADRDAIKAKFPESEGWKCKDTGKTTATCSNPPK
jgi:hypothetical protein